MVNWPRPANIKALRGLLGLTSYYKRFVKNYGLIRRHLTELLKNDGFKWGLETERAFGKLKVAMSKTPVLGLPDFYTSSWRLMLVAQG